MGRHWSSAGFFIIQDPSTTLRDPRRKCCDDMVVMDKCFRGRNQDSLYTNCTDNSWSESVLVKWLYVTKSFVKLAGFLQGKNLGRKKPVRVVLCDKCFRERNQGSLCTNCSGNSWGESVVMIWLKWTNVFVEEIKAASARIALAIRGAKETC